MTTQVHQMECHHVSAYAIHGIAPESVSSCAPVVEHLDDSRRIRGVLVADPSSQLYQIDAGNARKQMLLEGLLAEPQREAYNQRLPMLIEQAQSSRRKLVGHGVALVIDIERMADVRPSDPYPDFDHGDFALCFDAVDTEGMREADKPVVGSIAAAMALACESFDSLERLAGGWYLVSPSGQIVHPCSPRVGGITRVYRSVPWPQHLAPRVGELASRIMEDDLQRAVELLLESSDRGTDRLRAFTSAWTALEVLASKCFKECQSEFLSLLRHEAGTSGSRRLAQLAQNGLKGWHNIATKFAVMSDLLGGDDREEDLKQFRLIKKVRDDLTHMGEADEDSLPLALTRSLLMRYLTAYLRRSPAQS